MRNRLTRLEAIVAREGTVDDQLRVLRAIADDQPVSLELGHVRLPLSLVRAVLAEDERTRS